MRLRFASKIIGQVYQTLVPKIQNYVRKNKGLYNEEKVNQQWLTEPPELAKEF